MTRTSNPLLTSSILYTLLLLFSHLPQLAQSRKISIRNSCASTIWPGLFTGSPQTVPAHPTGWEMSTGEEESFEVSDEWIAGRIWARMGCGVDDTGRFRCLTGGCGSGERGDMTCQVTNEPPATLAEFTLARQGVDHYDISLVDGFNVPMNIYPSDKSCEAPSCEININAVCPPLLRSGVEEEGKNLGCLAACNAGFGQEKYGNRACCSGGYNDPELCEICGVDYYNVFKDNCKSAYAYAYDEKSGTALWTCPTSSNSLPDYTIEFCPSQTDYKGTKEYNLRYANSTATCTNRVTSGNQVFEVKSSPTLDGSERAVSFTSLSSSVKSRASSATEISVTSISPLSSDREGSTRTSRRGAGGHRTSRSAENVVGVITQGISSLAAVESGESALEVTSTISADTSIQTGQGGGVDEDGGAGGYEGDDVQEGGGTGQEEQQEQLGNAQNGSVGGQGEKGGRHCHRKGTGGGRGGRGGH